LLCARARELTHHIKHPHRTSAAFAICAPSPRAMSIIAKLKHDLHPCLMARIHQPRPPPNATSSEETNGFVLYLPTVCLRMDQNPAFALACHAANALNLPLVVLAVVIDDLHHNTHVPNGGPTVMTSRRLAFTLQALSHACAQWSANGAAVGIRIHAPPSQNEVNGHKIVGARTPDHLSLASRASFVVLDESFVYPFLGFVQKVEQACSKSNVECVRVDGSCTVPPLQVLKRTRNTAGVLYEGVPDKAYLWMKKTETLRGDHLKAASDGAFDAPVLKIRLKDEELFAANQKSADGTIEEESLGKQLAQLFPSRWKATLDSRGNSSLPNAPDVRPFTSHELSDLYRYDDYFDDQSQSGVQAKVISTTPFHNFALNWPGADQTVPPVTHTIGTKPYGLLARWNTWVQNGRLSRYAKERNDARNNLNGVSRMSAYLNLGIVSIFKLVSDMKLHSTYGGSANNSKWKSGADKFEEELIKFREHSYAHCFSRTDYDTVSSLPRWSVQYLNQQEGQCAISQLANGNSNDKKWNAMQKYLVNTGELHNNVRMTWGKSVVEWGVDNDRDSSTAPAQTLLEALCYLNDRYALDGLSPPSYGGLLWCMGWTDKPDSNGGVSPKPAYRYKMTVEDFQEAEKKLVTVDPNDTTGTVDRKLAAKAKGQCSLKEIFMRQSTSDGQIASAKITSKEHCSKRKATIDLFFERKNPKL